MKEELKNLITRMEGISSAWNSKDEGFLFEGEPFSEEHAHIADDIIKTAKALDGLLDEFETA